MPWKLPEDFEAALAKLVSADPKNSNKGKYVTKWFKDTFDVDGRASVVSETKQVYNRVPEQFKHGSAHVVFVCHDDATSGKLVEQVKKHAYPGLESVLIVRETKNEFQPELLLLDQDSDVTEYYKDVFDGIPTDVLTASEEADVMHYVEGGEDDDELLAVQDSEVSWESLNLANESPCGLVGLQKPLIKAVSALKSKKHIVFIGPPGTGKSELAQCLCTSLGVEFDLVTATSDWTSFDTIGGYMPDPSLGQTPEPLNFFSAGIVKAMEQNRWIIIDELNRADIDKAFGEMFTLLSSRRPVKLPFFRRDASGGLKRVVLGNTEDVDDTDYVIPMPTDWHIIGTMNTFDKASLFQLSFAFMRRFAFIDIPLPSPGHYKQILSTEAQKLFGESKFGSDCLDLLFKVFVPDPSEGLGALGLLVGPSIPLDILRYLEERYDLELEILGEDTIDVVKLVLEALEMYLYPQFEGQDEKHTKILEAITDALDLSEEDAGKETERILAGWTGFLGDGSEDE